MSLLILKTVVDGQDPALQAAVERQFRSHILNPSVLSCQEGIVLECKSARILGHSALRK
jgi:hypothetical protein